MSTTEDIAQPLLARPKRADARRNYEKVLAAAREAFAEGGESTSLEEIARRAGVGIGTLYRHFPNRQALLEALYLDEVEEVCRGRPRQLEGERPVGGAQRLVRALHRLHRHQAGARRRAAQLPRPGRPALQGLPRVALRRRRAAAPARAGGGRRAAGRQHRRGHPDGRRDRQDPGRPIPRRPSTSCASPSTGCATAPSRRGPRPSGRASRSGV